MKLTIYEQLQEVLKERIGNVVTTEEVRTLLFQRYGTNRDSVLLSDYCYNRYNKGIAFNKYLFEYIARGQYKYVGEGAIYTGLVFNKPRGMEEQLVGEWVNGKLFLFDESLTTEERQEKLSKQQLIHLYKQYIAIFNYETKVLKYPPTELRHLLGRIGEFLCAIETDGKLTQNVNEKGFDVVSGNRKISVKATAQTNGFIAINQNTFHLFDDLFIVQYKDGEFTVVYNGPKEAVLPYCRIFKSTYELDLSKLKKLKKQS